MKYVGVLSGTDPATLQAQKVQNNNLLRVLGTQQAPDPPRGLVAQSASRSIVVAWSLPVQYTDIVGWRVYKDTEGQLFSDIRDRGTRQCTVPADAGSSPPTVNVFVSSVNAAGVESPKVQVQGKATVEAGAPTVPSISTTITGTNSSASYGTNKYQSAPGGRVIISNS